MNHLAIITALGLDGVLRDPELAFHPVRLIGRFIAMQEAFYRRSIPSEFIGGLALSAVTVAGVFFASFGLVMVVERVNPIGGFFLNVLLIYFSISPAALAGEGANIFRLLVAGKEEEARTALSRIVGRDTKEMDRAAILRAAIETLAENSVDAVVAPLLFAALGGGPLAMAYRAANTCDSMVGYRDPKYEWFGKPSARLDDLLNFIPARLAVPFAALAAWLCGLNAGEAWRTGLGDRLKHPSPNSAHGEAAFAGALGVRLGGLSSYGGVPKEKPWLGEENRQPEPTDLAKAITLLRALSLVAAFFAALLAFGISRHFPA